MKSRSKSTQRIEPALRTDDDSEVLKQIGFEDCSDTDLSHEEYRRKVLCVARKSAKNSALKVDKKKSDEIYLRLRAAEEKREENISRLKLEKLIQETNECHFTPEIITKNRKAKHEKVFLDRVDQLLKDKKEKIAQKKIEEVCLREEEMKENCTFQPKINRDASTSKVKQQLSDISSWKRRCQDKIFEEFFDSKEVATFAPAISKRSQDIVRAKTPEQQRLKVEDRLYQLSKLKKDNPNQASHTSVSVAREPSTNKTPTRGAAARKSVNKPKETPNRTVITVDQLCASVNQSLSRLSTINDASRSTANVHKKSKGNAPKTHLRSTQEEAKAESVNTFGVNDVTAHTEVELLEETQLPKSEASEGLHQLDREEDRHLLDCLHSDSFEQYNPDNLTAVFNNILNNPERRKIEQFIPQEKCRTKKDGRKYLKIGEVRIFYDDSCVGEIINFSLRSKLASSS